MTQKIAVGALVVIFAIILGIGSIIGDLTSLKFGNVDFWQAHGWIFLAMITFFPRLTLFFSSVSSGGLLWWISWLVAPRILVAILATFGYWETNPFLVILSWLLAFGGESSEKLVMSKGVNLNTKKKKHTSEQRADDIEADFKVK
ncbi:MAG: hypothetical protein KAG61_01770 [Bacteriovoracaceae bacterium]|nr:hypothetical protein [Bacteriovoracaceae bacterium]